MSGFSSESSDGEEEFARVAPARFGARRDPPAGMRAATVNRRETFNQGDQEPITTVEDTSFRRTGERNEERAASRQPQPAAGWHSQFDSLGAAVSVAKRIYDTKLLPPHTRTLNFSLLKTLLGTVAMLSNRTVKEYYEAYNDSDAAAYERFSSGNAEVRKIKAAIREYVDRSLCVRDFLETELLSSNFTAAFEECLAEVRREAGDDHPLVVALMERKGAEELYFNPLMVACVIHRHSDVRGNVDGDRASREILNKPLETYNTLQASLGSSVVQYDEIYQLLLDNPHRTEKLQRYLKDITPNLLKFINNQVQRVPPGQTVLKEIVSQLRHRYMRPPWVVKGVRSYEQVQQLQHDFVQIDGHFEVEVNLNDVENNVPVPTNRRQGEYEQTPLENILKKVIDIWDTNSFMDEPVSLLDIAILGGLHPRSYGLLNKKLPVVEMSHSNVVQKVASIISTASRTLDLTINNNSMQTVRDPIVACMLSQTQTITPPAQDVVGDDGAGLNAAVNRAVRTIIENDDVTSFLDQNNTSIAERARIFNTNAEALKNILEAARHAHACVRHGLREYSNLVDDVLGAQASQAQKDAAKILARKVVDAGYRALDAAVIHAIKMPSTLIAAQSAAAEVADAAQRRADELSEPFYTNYDIDSFFTKCMDVFDTKLLKLREEIADDGFTRDADTAMVLFTLPLPARSTHASYLLSERNPYNPQHPPRQAPQGLSIFGAPAQPRCELFPQNLPNWHLHNQFS